MHTFLSCFRYEYVYGDLTTLTIVSLQGHLSPKLLLNLWSTACAKYYLKCGTYGSQKPVRFHLSSASLNLQLPLPGTNMTILSFFEPSIIYIKTPLSNYLPRKLSQPSFAISPICKHCILNLSLTKHLYCILQSPLYFQMNWWWVLPIHLWISSAVGYLWHIEKIK